MIEQVQSRRVAGIAARCSNGNPAAIGALWERFFRDNVANTVKGNGMYAVYFDYEGDFTKPYTLLIGAEIARDTTVPQGVRECLIEAGPYQPFDASGPKPGSIIAAWQRVWASNVPRAYRTDFESYGPGEQVTIFVGLRQ